MAAKMDALVSAIFYFPDEVQREKYKTALHSGIDLFSLYVCFPKVVHVMLPWRTVSCKFCFLYVHMYEKSGKDKGRIPLKNDLGKKKTYKLKRSVGLSFLKNISNYFNDYAKLISIFSRLERCNDLPPYLYLYRN